MLFVMNFFSLHPRSFEDDFKNDLQSLIKSDERKNARLQSQSDVKSNSKPATLLANDKHSEIPQVTVRTYLISVKYRQVIRSSRNH